MLYMVTFTINIPPMLAYIAAPWILWVLDNHIDSIPRMGYGSHKFLGPTWPRTRARAQRCGSDFRPSVWKKPVQFELI